MTERTNITSPGRRAFLSTAAALVVSAAVAAPAAVAALQSDPVFAAIDAHKAARVVMIAAVDAVSARENALVAEGKRWNQPERDAKLQECESALSEKFEAETDAACVLVSAPPATMAGVIALLQYAIAADTDGNGWPELASDDHKRERSWQFFLIEMLSDVLPGMVQS